MATPTKLQNRINDLYSSYSNNFADNKDYLRSISDIAGNRGLSHKKRVESINNWINKIGDSLTDSEKEYVSQLLRTNKNYIKETQKVKDSHEVRENIYHIRKEMRNNRLENEVYKVEKNALDSKPMSLTEIPIANITETVIPYGTYGTPRILEGSNTNPRVIMPDFESYSRTRLEKAPGFLRRAGKALTKTLVTFGVITAVGVAVFFAGRYSGKKSQEPIIESQQDKITCLDQKISSLEYKIKKDGIYKAEIEKIIEETSKRAREQADYLQKLSAENLPANIAWEERMAMHGNTSSGPADKCKVCTELGIEKQQYLKDKPGDYPKRLDERCKQLNKEGKHLEDAMTRVGWVAAVGNDVIEGPVRFLTGLGGGIWGAGSKIIGNENDGFDNGWKNGDQFGAYVIDGFYGGVTKTEFDGMLLSLKPEEALDLVYYMEDTTLGGHAKLGEVIFWDFIAPFVANNNLGNGGNGHHAGSVIKPVEGVTGGREWQGVPRGGPALR